MAIPKAQRIIWLVSYPKSGNTWIRFLLTALCLGKLDTSNDVEQFIPEIGGSGSNSDNLGERSGTHFVKTHHLFNTNLSRVRSTASYIYIIRHPFDVMMSNYHYHISRLETETGMSEEQYKRIYLSNYIKNGGDRMWLRLGYGSWYDNVTSWTEAAPKTFPGGIILRYEEMLKDPLKAAIDIVTRYGLNYSEERIKKAVELSSFQNMKAMEAHELENRIHGLFMLEQPMLGKKKIIPFMNKGTSGQSFKEVDDDLKLRFQNVFSEPLAKLGYSMDSK